MLIDDFIFGIVTNLCTDLIKTFGESVYTIVAGSDEERAINRIYERVFSTVLNRTSVTPGSINDHVLSLLQELVSESRTASYLVDFVLTNHEFNLNRFRSMLISLGYDPFTMVGIENSSQNFDLVLVFLSALRSSVLIEAKQGSPISPRITLTLLNKIYDLNTPFLKGNRNSRVYISYYPMSNYDYDLLSLIMQEFDIR